MPHITRALAFALLVAIVTLAASWGHNQPAPAHVNAAAASRSSPVQEQPLPLPRVGLGAAMGADGRVYTIGGNGPENERDPNNEHDLGVMEAYDPRRNTWACSSDDASSGCATHNLAPLPTPRQWLAAALGRDGHNYVFGGYNPSGGYLATMDAYVPATNTWSTAAPMPSRRGFLSAARGGDGRLYAIGGYNGRQALRTVEAYDPHRNIWTTVASLPAARDCAVAVAGPGGQIYLPGGNDLTTATYFDTVLVYNPSSDHWVTLPTRLSRARWNLAAAAHPNGLIYALGGIGDCLVDLACPTQPTATGTPTNTSTPTSVSVPAHAPAATTPFPAGSYEAARPGREEGRWIGKPQRAEAVRRGESEAGASWPRSSERSRDGLRRPSG